MCRWQVHGACAWREMYIANRYLKWNAAGWTADEYYTNSNILLVLWRCPACARPNPTVCDSMTMEVLTTKVDNSWRANEKFESATGEPSVACDGKDSNHVITTWLKFRNWVNQTFKYPKDDSQAEKRVSGGKRHFWNDFEVSHEGITRIRSLFC